MIKNRLNAIPNLFKTERIVVHMNRRAALKWILFSGLVGISRPGSVLANIPYPVSAKRSLSLLQPNSQERLQAVYWENGHYVGSVLDEINYFLRDRRTGETKPIDPNLLELLFAIKKTCKTREPLHVLSGYRSPETNALLRNKGKNASTTSYHKQGKAVDIRLPGYRCQRQLQTSTDDNYKCTLL